MAILEMQPDKSQETNNDLYLIIVLVTTLEQQWLILHTTDKKVSNTIFFFSMDVLSISLIYLCACIYLIHALQLVCRWGVIAENALFFHMRSISTAESISIF